MNRKILIVDDEKSINNSLTEILDDNGYKSHSELNFEDALTYLKENKPDVVLLDIWLPGIDGIQALGQIKELYPSLPIIMMSGHASIQTAVSATKQGAFEFLEKPLDLDNVLNTINRALTNEELEISKNVPKKAEDQSFFSNDETYEFTNLIYPCNKNLGTKRTQKTLKSSAVIYGIGIHTGQKSGLVLKPLEANSGIHFVSVSETVPTPGHVKNIITTGWNTTVKTEKGQISTIEHLLSALNAYGISNLLIKCNGEIPIMDGSAIEFCNLIEETGVVDQKEDVFDLKIEEKIEIDTGSEYICVEPADDFIINYTLDYPSPVGRQVYEFKLSDIESYKNEIATCRTFGFVKDIEAIQKIGLAQGGRLDNVVIYGDDGALNTELRFKDESVRHKILDTIGDLYLLGRRIQGKITAVKTGHSNNISLLNLIWEKYLKEQ